MKILVAVKRVIDPYVKIRINTTGTGEIESQNVKHSMNPFDEIALEEAIRLLEKKIASEVVVVSIGTDSAQETLRHALALGANRAILIKSTQSHDSLNIAKILAKVVTDEAPQLVLMGKQAIDDDNNQVPQMLAGLLKWPQATFASAIQIEQQSCIVKRETDQGIETIQLQLPAVISADLRLNEPRYASLPNIMKAKQKPLTVIELDALALPLKIHQQRLSIKAPAQRKGGIKLNSVDELIKKLKEEAKIL